MDWTTTGDDELLSAFIKDRQQEAFAEIVRRHGPLVMAVCRSVLGNSSDVEDAAQAVFLTLNHKAMSLRGRSTLASWLHRVAWYAARYEKRSAAVRARHEREAAIMKQRSAQTNKESVPQDLLHAGLVNLPEKYRLPIILHHLEGRPQEEVADMLGSNVGTVAMRLNRGRQMLRDRLAKTGAAVSVTGLAAAMADQASAAVSPAFVASVTKMAVFTLTTKATAAGAASAKILALSKGAMNMLLIAKVKAVALLAAVVLLVGGTAACTYMAVAAATQSKPAESQPAAHAKPGSPDNPVKIPQIKEVAVDGDLKEWNDVKPLPLLFMKKDAGSLKLAWTKDGLFGAMSVKRDEIKVDTQKPWAGDCVELFIEKDCVRAKNRADTKNAAQYAFAPSLESDGGNGTIVVAWGADRDKAADLACSWKKTKDGFALEFSIPVKVLDPAKMQEGTKLGFNFAINKNGKADELFYADTDIDNSYCTPSTWGAIILDK
ncbi:MAG: sigma-70 family RNA polymerase sigma factor [Planctomycetes bacterium]|nr:sigma-70 family RNA polymerase sigma factor [Planctomycetota bacterium]